MYLVINALQCFFNQHAYKLFPWEEKLYERMNACCLKKHGMALITKDIIFLSLIAND